MSAEAYGLAEGIAAQLVKLLPTARWDDTLANEVSRQLGNGDAARAATLTDELRNSQARLVSVPLEFRERVEREIYDEWRRRLARLLIAEPGVREPAKVLKIALLRAGGGVGGRRPRNRPPVPTREAAESLADELPMSFHDVPASRDRLIHGVPREGSVNRPARAEGTAWPHLRAPAVVAAGTGFQIEVGLRDVRDRSVYGTGKLIVPAGDFTLGVELLVDGFTVVGDRFFTLDVTVGNRRPRRKVTLVASADPDLVAHRRIGVVFRVGSEIRGYAARDVYVTAVGQEPAAAPSATQPAFAGFDVSPFEAPQAADLTVVIQQGDAEHGSRFMWSVASPRLDLDLPADNTGPFLQSSAERFLGELVAEASGTADPLDLVTSLIGQGKADIAPLMPRFVKEALRKVAEEVAPQRPTILLLSQDPYIPWELAVLDPPLPGWPPDESPFLGAQAVIGRWVLAAEPPPVLDPPQRVLIREQVVIAGDYQGVLDWSKLESAEKEAEVLRERWPAARSVEAKLSPVLECLYGRPGADIIHFALHGQFATDDARQGLVLIDESGTYPVYLKPSHVDAGKFSRAPLVFLNACQVGAGRAVLGNYSGMAGAFVRAGAAAVVAPLWSVNDETASEIALCFYQSVLDGAEAPAEVLRSFRAGVTLPAIAAGAPAASGTHIAYQFFGHPNLRLLERP